MAAVGFDVETSKRPRHLPYHEGSFLVNACLSWEDGSSRVLTFNHQEAPDVNQFYCIQEIQSAFDEADRIVGHNLKFDLLWAKKLALNFENNKLFCTMIAEYLISGQTKQEYSLAAVSERRGIAQKLDKVKAFWEAGIETDEIPLDILEPYVKRDAENTLAIYLQQIKEIKEKGLVRLAALQMEVMRCLIDIEWAGMFVCCDRMEDIISDLSRKKRDLEVEIKEVIGWDCNLSSNDELSVALYGGTLMEEQKQPYVTTRNLTIKEPFIFTYKSGLQKKKYRNKILKELIVKTRKIKVPIYYEGLGFTPPKDSRVKKSIGMEAKESFYSTDKNTIKFLKARNKKQKKLLKLLNDYSVTNKAYQSFLGKGDAGLANKIQPDGCVHPNYNQTVTTTGRLSSSEPNGQNFPRKGTSPIKRIFIPRKPGWRITNADLAQLEWRMAAFMSQDPVAIDEILNDVDYHLDNARKFFGANPTLPADHPDVKAKRTVAKAFGFMLLYGGTPYGFFKNPLMPNYSIKQWEKIVAEYYEKYKVLGDWQKTNIDTVYRDDGVLQLMTGRLFHFVEEPEDKKDKYAPQKIKNYPVQGTSMDAMGMAMVNIRRKLRAAKMQTLMIGQVHDAIVFDGPAEEVLQVSKICLETFRDLPRLLSIFWKCDFNVPMDGDVESGISYAETMKLAA
jgi:DNA polymerase I-like protein with 3'-5' exonuclease and polymerase domains